MKHMNVTNTLVIVDQSCESVVSNKNLSSVTGSVPLLILSQLLGYIVFIVSILV